MPTPGVDCRGKGVQWRTVAERDGGCEADVLLQDIVPVEALCHDYQCQEWRRCIQRLACSLIVAELSSLSLQFVAEVLQRLATLAGKLNGMRTFSWAESWPCSARHGSLNQTAKVPSRTRLPTWDSTRPCGVRRGSSQSSRRLSITTYKV